jgi:hypothetical protein
VEKCQDGIQVTISFSRLNVFSPPIEASFPGSLCEFWWAVCSLGHGNPSAWTRHRNWMILENVRSEEMYGWILQLFPQTPLFFIGRSSELPRYRLVIVHRHSHRHSRTGTSGDCLLLLHSDPWRRSARWQRLSNQGGKNNNQNLRRLNQVLHFDIDIQYSLKIQKSQELVKFDINNGGFETVKYYIYIL